MKVLITGAAGFIGSHLADAYIDGGWEVVGVDDLSTGRADNFPKGGELIVGDITDAACLVGKWDLIFHCAASYHDRTDWERDASVNVLGTINVVREAMRSDAKLIYFQTSLCYGRAPASPVQVDAPLNPEGSYAVSKTAGEAYIRDSGVPWVSLRLANIYGPRNISGPPPTFYKRLSEGQPCTIVDSRRDFVYIDDLVNAALRAAQNGEGVYHVSSGKDYAILDLYSAVVEAMGLDVLPPETTPRGPDDPATILIDPAATYDALGWSAHVPLEIGMREAVRWYKEHGVEQTFTHLVAKG